MEEPERLFEEKRARQETARAVSGIRRLAAEIIEAAPEREAHLMRRLEHFASLPTTMPALVVSYCEAYLAAVREGGGAEERWFGGYHADAELPFAGNAVVGLPVEYAAMEVGDVEERPEVDGLAQAMMYLRNYVMGVKGRLEDGRGLTLYGDTGTGKTLIAALAAKAAAGVGAYCYYVRARRMFDALKPGGDADVRAAVADCRFLIVDDLGDEYQSEFTLSELDNLVTRRYNECKVTTLTTNYYPDELAAELAERVLDRMGERNRAFTLKGPSYRRKGDEEDG